MKLNKYKLKNIIELKLAPSYINCILKYSTYYIIKIKLYG